MPSRSSGECSMSVKLMGRSYWLNSAKQYWHPNGHRASGKVRRILRIADLKSSTRRSTAVNIRVNTPPESQGLRLDRALSAGSGPLLAMRFPEYADLENNHCN